MRKIRLSKKTRQMKAAAIMDDEIEDKKVMTISSERKASNKKLFSSGREKKNEVIPKTRGDKPSRCLLHMTFCLGIVSSFASIRVSLLDLSPLSSLGESRLQRHLSLNEVGLQMVQMNANQTESKKSTTVLQSRALEVVNDTELKAVSASEIDGASDTLASNNTMITPFNHADATHEFFNSPLIPNWMRQYFLWHQKTRIELDRAHANNPDSVLWRNYRYLVISCLRRDLKCGGASDWLQAIPAFVLMAKLTGRLLLIEWERPAPLEEFLVPTGILDWRMPNWLKLKADTKRNPSDWLSMKDFVLTFEQKKAPARRNYKALIISAQLQVVDHGEEFFNAYHDGILVQQSQTNFMALPFSAAVSAFPSAINGPSSVNWTHFALEALATFDARREFVDDPSVFARYPYGLERRVSYYKSMYRTIWKALFKPSPAVASELANAKRKMGIMPKQIPDDSSDDYGAVHIRSAYTKDNSDDGLRHRQAVNCIAQLTTLQRQNQKQELLLHRPEERSNNEGQKAKTDYLPPILIVTDNYNVTRKAARHGRRILKRRILTVPVSDGMLHLDRGSAFLETSSKAWNWHEYPASAYYNVFVDLYLLADASCVAYEKGGFGRWGLALSRNITCGINHSRYFCNSTGMYSKSDLQELKP